MSLVGMSMLFQTSPEICLRFVCTDCVESFFSSIRATVRGGGQLNVLSHRLSVRRAMIFRLKLLSYLDDMIERSQPCWTSYFNKQPHGLQHYPAWNSSLLSSNFRQWACHCQICQWMGSSSSYEEIPRGRCLSIRRDSIMFSKFAVTANNRPTFEER